MNSGASDCYMKTEEKYPLLLVYLDDGHVKNHRRSDKITAGATAVITRWPSDITASCWLGLLLFGLTIFLFFLMALTLRIEHPSVIFHNAAAKQELKCLKLMDVNPNQDHIYLVHTTNEWSIRELNTLSILLKHYRDYNTTLIILKNCSTEQKNLTATRYTSDLKYHLMKEYNNLKIVHYNCSEYFTNTPLAKCWQNLNSHVINFLTRIILLWEHSGMSFNLKTKLINQSKNENETTERYTIDKNGISSNKTNELALYPNVKSIPDDSVMLDIDGNFLATRTICHTFFEYILQQTKSQCHHLITVQKLITDSIRVFCKQGGIDFKYCDITN